MSYIDTIDHELIGYLNGLPIYHPLESVSKGTWGEYDFSCSPSNLVLGGGSGEHPALILHKLESFVAKYILFDDDQKVKHFADRGYKPLEEDVLNQLIDISEVEDKVLEFCDWSMIQTYDFVELAKSRLHSTPLLEAQSVEKWIQLSIGELIYFSLGDLNPAKIKIDNLLNIEWPIAHWMNNVTCPPPNYIKSKKESLSQTGFQLKGFFRWDYNYPPVGD
jgi:hypothetical protein